MIRLLIDTEAPASPAAVTRFGGLPSIPAHAQFDWPHCASCDGAMQFLGQIALDGDAAGRLVLLFMCQNSPGMCDDWDAEAGGNRAVVVAADDAGRVASAPEGDTVVRDSAYGVQIEDVDAAGYDDARQQWAQQHDGALRRIQGCLGGEPSWLQADETPSCDACGNTMSFVAQLEEGPDHRTAMNFGGGGCGYVFHCGCSEPGAKFLWQCG
ncbi:hypothetical protein ACV229_01565 [Burkholderia sp. MR1-5-21]